MALASSRFRDETRFNEAVRRVESQIITIKKLLWAYLILVFVIGIFRKWLLQPLAEPLQVIHVPIALLAIFYGWRSGLLKNRPFLSFLNWLGAFELLIGCWLLPNPLTAVYGWVCYFMPLPLIFMYGKVFTREDLNKAIFFVVCVAVPNAVLMYFQFKSPAKSWINATPDLSGGLLNIDAEHVRPPGVFTFVTGPAYFYTLVLAIAMGMPRDIKHRNILTIAAYASVVVGVVFSGSRTLWANLAILLVCYVFFSVLGDARTIPRAIGLLLAITVMFAVALLIPAVNEAITVFINGRLGNGGVLSSEFQGRAFGNFTTAMEYLFEQPIFGHGLGSATAAGGKLSGYEGYVFGNVEFPLAGNVIELGGPIGGAFIGLRLGSALVFILSGVAVVRDRREWFPFACACAAAPALYGSLLGQMAENGLLVVLLGFYFMSLRIFSSDEEVAEVA